MKIKKSSLRGLFVILTPMKDITGKISLDETNFFDADGFSGQEYVTREMQAGFNALLVTVAGRHTRKRMIDTTRAYFVVEGTGTFILDEDSHQVEKGDLFIIAPGHEYEYSGTMKLFEFNISPDNSSYLPRSRRHQHRK
jgi:mannose-6-phosphate isomerase-like protein (cupin superfamily)